MKVMNDLNKELQEKTGGQVKFKFYAGHLRRRKGRRAQGAGRAASRGGLYRRGSGRDRAPRILDAPWLFRNDKEVDFIYKTFDKDLSAAIEKAGYAVGLTESVRARVQQKSHHRAGRYAQAKMWVWGGTRSRKRRIRPWASAPSRCRSSTSCPPCKRGLIDAVYGPPMGVTALHRFTRTAHLSVPMARSAGAVLYAKKMFDRTAQDREWPCLRFPPSTSTCSMRNPASRTIRRSNPCKAGLKLSRHAGPRLSSDTRNSGKARVKRWRASSIAPNSSVASKGAGRIPCWKN